MDERPLPKRSWRRNAAIVIGFIAFTAAIEWLAIRLDSRLLVGLPFFMAMIVGICGYHQRCPACHRRLQPRKKMLGSTRYRIVYDCSHCQITWDSHLDGDTKYDDS